MILDGPCLRLTVLVGESDTVGHTPLATEIVHRAHAAGLAGATVFRGVEGYGASNHLHTTRGLSLSSDLPMAVVVIDTEQRIRSFLPVVRSLASSGLIVVEPVEVVGLDGDGAGSGDVDGRQA